jgi:signal transduction histidine kinase/ActR/RegA family two-component response regulator
VSQARNFGVAVFDYAAGTNGYQMLRDQIAAALRTVSLHHEVVIKTMLHERSVQERVATGKRMQSLSVLAGGVAHDLNNALGPLVGLPEIMLSELDRLGVPGVAAQELRGDLETILSATVRASQTIKDLLTLSRQGRTPKEPLDLCRTVAQCLGGEALRCVREVNPSVRIVCDPTSEPLIVRGSGAHVGRAVMNLVRNAVEAVGPGGEVRIRTFGLDLREPINGYETIEPGSYAVVAVSDNGPGIPLHELGWVFEPFASKKRMSETSGTGLGLAIVHGVIKEHEGFVDVASTVGVGTTFTLYFPRAEECIQPFKESSVAPRGSARILVVDDEPIQLRTARRVLTHLGYEVEGIRSGLEALRAFATAPAGDSPYDVVLLDMMLNEDEDGLQIFEEIRTRFPLQRAIIASGHAPTERVERAFAEGLGWLAKPYTAEALAGAIREALRDVREPSWRPSLSVHRSAPTSAPP